MTKIIGDNKVKHISLLILKISFLTLYQIIPLFGYRVSVRTQLSLGLNNLGFHALAQQAAQMGYDFEQCIKSMKVTRDNRICMLCNVYQTRLCLFPLSLIIIIASFWRHSSHASQIYYLAIWDECMEIIQERQT